MKAHRYRISSADLKGATDPFADIRKILALSDIVLWDNVTDEELDLIRRAAGILWEHTDSTLMPISWRKDCFTLLVHSTNMWGGNLINRMVVDPVARDLPTWEFHNTGFAYPEDAEYDAAQQRVLNVGMQMGRVMMFNAHKDARLRTVARKHVEQQWIIDARGNNHNVALIAPRGLRVVVAVSYPSDISAGEFNSAVISVVNLGGPDPAPEPRPHSA